MTASNELLERQRARLLEIVDVELGRIWTGVQCGPLDSEQRKTLEAVARLIRDLERAAIETADKPAEKLSAEEIGKALRSNPG